VGLASHIVCKSYCPVTILQSFKQALALHNLANCTQKIHQQVEATKTANNNHSTATLYIIGSLDV
jgi:hypothetical protein